MKKVTIGGDGTGWIRAACDLYPQRHIPPRPLPLKKAPSRGVGFHSMRHHEAVCEGIEALDLEATLKALDEAVETKRGDQRKRALSLRGYILENWDGTSSLPEEERLGAIEGQVRHTIARRMRRTDAGADHMARVLAAKSNGELKRYASGSKRLRREAFQGIVHPKGARTQRRRPRGVAEGHTPRAQRSFCGQDPGQICPERDHISSAAGLTF